MQNHETRREDLLRLFSAKTTVSFTGDSVKVTACKKITMADIQKTCYMLEK